jgi:hypothetical protein
MMATNKYSNPALNPPPGILVEFRPPKNPFSHTGYQGLDEYLSTPAEIRQAGDHTVEIHRDPTTHVAISEEWRNKDGQYDRQDGAAYISRDPRSGIVDGEEWMRNGRDHRIGGPAVWCRDDTGVIGVEHYYVDGKLHREDGPAWTHRDPATGAVISQARYLHGQRLTDRRSSPGPVSRQRASTATVGQLSMTFADVMRAASRRRKQCSDTSIT